MSTEANVERSRSREETQGAARAASAPASGSFVINTLAITRREFAAYFNSPIAYIIIFAFLALNGWLYFDSVFLFNQASLRDFFARAPLIFLFFAPLITMRLLAEERRTGTIELLITLPIRDTEVVLGKYLAALGLFAAAIAMTLTYPLSIGKFGDLDSGPVIGGYLGLLLLGGGYLAIGLMASAWTRNQIVAAIIGVCLCLLMFVIDSKVELMPPALAPIIQGLSPSYHFRNIARGVIDLRDVLYFLSLIGGCLLVAIRSLESRQWR